MYTNFIDIYDNLSGNNDNNDDENNINIKLDPKFPLYKFLIVDENEFCEKYKLIYKQFIDKHNEIVGKLLEAKYKNSDDPDYLDYLMIKKKMRFS